jgi:hypothetical protein
MLLVTQVAFAIVVQLVKVKCKRKSFNLIFVDINFVDLVSFKYF